MSTKQRNFAICCRIAPNFKGEDYADLFPDVLANTLNELDKLP